MPLGVTKEDLYIRFQTHDASVDQLDRMADVRIKAGELADFIADNVPAGREQSSAITHLEEVVFWANAGISRPKLRKEGLI